MSVRCKSIVVCIAAATFVASCLAESNRRCPAGQVWSGEACVVHAYCKDGTPWVPGSPCPAGSAALLPQPGVALPKKNVGLACSRQTQFSIQRGEKGSAPGRVLVVSDGKVDELFERYVDDARRSSIELDLKQLRLVFVDKESGYLELLAPRLGVQELFRLSTPRALWLKKLQGRWAQRVLNAESEAVKRRADLICGTSSK